MKASGRVGAQAEVVREDALPDQPGDPAEENAGGDQAQPRRPRAALGAPKRRGGDGGSVKIFVWRHLAERAVRLLHQVAT